MPTTTTPCLFYFISLNSAGFPIPGTMMAKRTNTIPANNKCRMARLTPYQMEVPSGQTQCYGPGNMRYFYLYNALNGQIVPNSFWQQRGKPVNMYSGTNCILEYIPLSSNVNDPE